ncbi:MAG: D-alanyl-D-alanine carboxypeptidase [Lachnospiraceae bacterium]|nr:D-alanyl-D-alanine carboxypeptidase [Lachnospiraceae bacterium]MBP5275488.1 D-alanyl-D-alanine carboxypeptidase [Lachnospiraceae bacterium]
MKCINKYSLAIIICIFPLIFGYGCKDKDLEFKFDRKAESSSISISDSDSIHTYAEPFAKDLCVDMGDYADINIPTSYAAGLFDINRKRVIYGKNMYEEMTPASITKLLTTLVALKYCDLNKTLEFTKACEINESGAQKLNLKPGDTMTLEQALNILLLYSANDVALMIAENYDGGYDAFIDKMNEEAAAIGATHTHFVNPHGLTEEDHESSVYDLYLILNELVKYDKFVSIVSQPGYTTSFTRADGSIKTLEIKSTNLYFEGKASVPEGYTILGGKTGTTSAAGKCLIVYFQDSAGNPYISCILRSDDHDTLYEDMNTLITNAK